MTAVDHGTSRTILIVDDEEPMRRVMRSILAPLGYQLIEAEDGQAAIDTLTALRSIDLVLLDICMPGLDGIEVCRRIRGPLGLLTLPVVFATGVGDHDARVACKDAGGDDFLTKPIDQLELLARVRNLLTVKAYHDMLASQKQALEEQVNAARDTIVRLGQLASLGTLAGCVGHELGNLAGIFKGSLRFIEQALTAGAAPDQADLERLRRVGDHLTNHAHNLLRLGRPAADTQADADLIEVIHTTLAMLQTAGRTKRVTVQASVPRGPVRVAASRPTLEQLLINLVGNAADALREVHDRPGLVIVSVPPPRQWPRAPGGVRQRLRHPDRAA